MPKTEKTRAHENCCPLVGEKVFGSRVNLKRTIKTKTRKTFKGELVHFDLNELGVKHLEASHAERIYKVPNEVVEPKLPPEEIRRIRRKSVHVKNELKAAAKINDRKIQGLSHIYKLPAPVFTGKYYTPKYDSGYYPDWHKLDPKKHQNNDIVTSCKSPTYTEFVGKISYLVQQSRKKMILYSAKSDRGFKDSKIFSLPDIGQPVVKQSPKQCLLGRKQISIAGAVRRLFAIDEAKLKSNEKS